MAFILLLYTIRQPSGQIYLGVLVNAALVTWMFTSSQVIAKGRIYKLGEEQTSEVYTVEVLYFGVEAQPCWALMCQ